MKAHNECSAVLHTVFSLSNSIIFVNKFCLLDTGRSKIIYFTIRFHVHKNVFFGLTNFNEQIVTMYKRCLCYFSIDILIFIWASKQSSQCISAVVQQELGI